MTLKEMLSAQLSEVSHCGNVHVRQFSANEILKLTSDAQPDTERKVDGYRVRLFSQRYQQFTISRSCHVCGLTGEIICLDVKRKGKKQKRAHFNLYGITPSGRVVMMTKDHIIPKSKGGRDVISNYQTMCETCNGKKANK